MESRKLSKPQRWGLAWFIVIGLINLIEAIAFFASGQWVRGGACAFFTLLCALLAVSLLANPWGERK